MLASSHFYTIQKMTANTDFIIIYLKILPYRIADVLRANGTQFTSGIIEETALSTSVRF